MIRTIAQALKTILCWAGNAQLTNSGKLLRAHIAHAGLTCGQGNDFI